MSAPPADSRESALVLRIHDGAASCARRPIPVVCGSSASGIAGQRGIGWLIPGPACAGAADRQCLRSKSCVKLTPLAQDGRLPGLGTAAVNAGSWWLMRSQRRVFSTRLQALHPGEEEGVFNDAHEARKVPAVHACRRKAAPPWPCSASPFWPPLPCKRARLRRRRLTRQPLLRCRQNPRPDSLRRPPKHPSQRRFLRRLRQQGPR